MSTNIIMSIHPQYASLIDNGKKTIEIRTRKLNIESGSRLWIYKTMPESCISTSAIISEIIEISPQEAWKKYEKQMCISKRAFDRYTNARDVIYLLKLTNIKKLKNVLPLQELRKKIPPFFPPQFFKKLNINEDIYKELEKELLLY